MTTSSTRSGTATGVPSRAASRARSRTQAARGSIGAGRRAALRVLFGAASVALLSAHSPYRQWDVYRKARLVLLASGSDAAAVRLVQALAAIYARRLPDSRATHARARDLNDVGRLLASGQLDVAVLREGDAHALATAAPPFADNGPTALRTLAALGEHLLVCLDSVPVPAAYQLAEALSDAWHDVAPDLVRHARGPKPPQDVRVPLHAGAADYYREHG